MKTCTVIALGPIGYSDAFKLQERLVAARKRGDAPDVLLLCEHPHVYTLGRSGRLENLRVSRAALSASGIEFHHTNRGGDITYHGPGQIVGYPILQLGEIRRDVGWYVRQIEQAMMIASAAFAVDAFRIAGRTGVWVMPHGAQGETHGETSQGGAPVGAHLQERKIGAIGVHLSRWVTSHGFAYNVATDLRYFDRIVPCGIADRGATSLETVLQRRITAAEVVPHIVAGFGEALSLAMTNGTREELGSWIHAAAAEPVRVPGVGIAPG
jgi:lipoyl(octanoyl) transferase